jgi:hypothetical protein
MQRTHGHPVLADRVPAVFAAAAALVLAVAVAGCKREPAHSPSPGAMTPDSNSSTNRPLTPAQVIYAHGPGLLAIPGVAAVGEGALPSGAPCIRIYVVKQDDAMRRRLPKELDGYPVLVEESGPIRAFDTPDEDSRP